MGLFQIGIVQNIHGIWKKEPEGDRLDSGSQGSQV